MRRFTLFLPFIFFLLIFTSLSVRAQTNGYKDRLGLVKDLVNSSEIIMIWNQEMGSPRAGSDASGLQWFGLTKLPPLAFDHQQIISDVIRTIREGD